MNCSDKLTFNFHFLPNKTFESLENKDAKTTLLKWSMKDRIRIQAFSFDQVYQCYSKQQFLEDFFKDPEVFCNLQTLSSNGKWVLLGQQIGSVSIEDVSTTKTSMTFFDRLQNDEVVRKSGNIIRCFEEYYDDMIIDDELRKMLLVEDSDNYDLYSKEDRKEFLFHIFKHFCLGGSLCQFEDEMQPYLNMTRSLYKDLISVQKDPKTGQIVVASFVYKIVAKDKHGSTIFPSRENNMQDFAYVCIDPLKKHVYVLTHVFGVTLPEI
ncbi:hypothetical protein HELRODRAFT_156718 [Helobdella robusta]|uniref:Cilia- and flagella-associated protein 300 n=1 Tax=Helobdella robusta TaxID=6412 RepID=T1EM02_HELRO|nr:hypothetical protein HELRODRAFT_156718 [Helobdella robusta]ESO07101.1 hypothetical protein HELRODRAFT_156718 [Helobdella robusta]